MHITERARTRGLDDLQHAISGNIVHRVHAAPRPTRLDTAHCRGLADSEMDALIAGGLIA